MSLRVAVLALGFALFSACPEPGGSDGGSDSGNDIVAICGNGVLESPEECDGNALLGQTCASRGFVSGTLRCSASCTFDTSGCSSVVAATVVVNEVNASTPDTVEFFNPGTQAVDLTGWTFIDDNLNNPPYAFPSGTTIAAGGYLVVTQATDAGFPLIFVEPGLGSSGDMVRLRDPGGNVVSQTQWAAGQAAVSWCRIPNGTGSFFQCAVATFGAQNTTCGNAATEGAEVCDGTALANKTCATEGFASGTLACSPLCTALDTSGCTRCGNNTVDPPEVCDGTALGGLTCAGLGYASGTLTCVAGCGAVDEAVCVPLASCGNGAIDTGEVCDVDGGVLGGQSCDTIDAGFGGGTLGCHRSCARFDVSGCSRCGNGVAEGAEVCDKNDFKADSCAARGFATGALRCNAGCTAVDATHCSNVVIHNVSSSNPDKVELKNVGTAAASLGGWLMLDNNNNSAPFYVAPGTTLAPDASMLFIGQLLDGGVVNMAFGLGGADSVRLWDGETNLDGGLLADGGLGGVLIHSTTWPTNSAVESWCRLADGGFGGIDAGCPESCGNGDREGREECDGTDLGQMTCARLRFSSGTLGCTGGCLFDLSACVP